MAVFRHGSLVANNSGLYALSMFLTLLKMQEPSGRLTSNGGEEKLVHSIAQIERPILILEYAKLYC